ncbi:MAG: PAS domain S-box protein, partial [Dehalococcoidia bacterium]
HDDGSWRLVEGTGQSLLDNPAVQGVVVNFHDVTERKQAEGAIRQSEAKYAALIEQANDGLAIVQDEVITFVNKAFASLTGYSVEELVGMHALNIVAPEHGPMVAERYKSRVAGEQVAASYEFRVLCKDGTTKDVELSASAIEYEGRPASMATFRDITERKRAEADLLREKSFLEGLVSSLPGLFYLYLISGKGGFVRWNKNLETVSGYSSDEIRGADYLEFVASDDHEKMLGAAQRILDEGYASVEAELLTKDGRKIPHLFMGAPVTIENDEYIIGLALNVTESKRAEAGLKESEERFRATVEAIPVPVMISRKSDGTILFGNEHLGLLLGATSGTGVGRKTTDFFDDLADRQAIRDTLQRDGYLSDYEFRIKRADGSMRWAVTSSQPLMYQGEEAYLSGFCDVTERKQSEEALRESEHRYRHLVEQASDGIAIIQDAVVKYVNPGAATAMGCPAEDIVGTPISDFIHPDELSKMADRYRRRMAGEPVESVFESVIIRKDGSAVDVEASAALTTYQGRPADLVILRDITARKSAEQEKLRTEEQRQLTARLATVGQLAAGVAHELNNPLAAVQGFAQLLADRKDLEDSVRDDVEQIFNEAKRATRITANLLSFARKHRPEKRLTCINDVIEKSLELHAYRMRVNNVDVQTELDTGLPATMVDFHQMQQVFVNIIANADQAMTEAHGKGKLAVRSQWSGDTIKVTLADDGPGIPQEDLERIFEPFYTTKEEGKGTGLGLDICHGIVEAHGGRLRATSNVGEGTTFVIEIPVVSEGQATEEDDCVQSPGTQS